MNDAQLVATPQKQRRRPGDAFALRAKVSVGGRARDTAVVPDVTFGLELPDRSRRFYMVEIDRGTMPVKRSDYRQTSFEGKMRTYLAAYAAKQHTQRLGWRSFRVLTITTDEIRRRSMLDALRGIVDQRSIGPSLFWFSTFDILRSADPLAPVWQDGTGSTVALL